jgi:hypothetical protein
VDTKLVWCSVALIVHANAAPDSSHLIKVVFLDVNRHRLVRHPACRQLTPGGYGNANLAAPGESGISSLQVWNFVLLSPQDRQFLCHLRAFRAY